MKSVWTLMLSLFYAAIINGQSLTPQVVSSSGGYYSNTSGSLSFTTGEMSAVATYSNASGILTQGFQQSWDFNTSVAQYIDPDFKLGVYPNPSDGNFFLFTGAPSGSRIVVNIIDMLGNEIFSKEILLENNIQVWPFNMASAAEGIYLVSVEVTGVSAGSEKNYSKKIQIIH